MASALSRWCIAGLFGPLAAPAFAAVIPVTTTADALDPLDGLTSLREAFIQADAVPGDDTIVLQAGQIYVLDQCGEGALLHSTATHITVQGNGSVIRNTCADVRTIEATDLNGALTLQDIEMTGVPGTIILDGAAIFSDGGAITIVNGNLHGFAGSAGSEVIDGGSNGGSIELVNTQIWGNDASAVRLSFGSVTITDCLIADNTGGGVNLVDGSPLMVNRTEISRNGGRGLSTTGQGHTVATLDEVTIDENGDSGFSCSACRAVTITNSVITRNGQTAGPGGGGGVRVSYDQDDPLDAPSTLISGSVIDDNVAQHAGAGVEIGIVESSEPLAPPAVLEIRDTRIRGNRAVGAGFGGGGVAVRTGGLILAEDSIVAANETGTGGDGGGILLREDGAIATPSAIVIEDSEITDNIADRAGGGVHLTTDGVVAIDRSVFADNAATTGSGGGLVLSDADAQLTATTVDNNSAATGGGGIVLAVATSPTAHLDLVRSTVSHNRAVLPLVGHGGGILADDEETGLSLVLENTTVSNNTAAMRGGGLHAYGGTHVTLHHATVVENQAPVSANLHMVAGTLDLQASVLALPVGADNATLLAVTVNSAGGNFTSDGSLGLGAPDTVSAADPQLAPLALNGGPTETRLPAMTSPLAGRIAAAAVSLPNDQRGITRPQGAGIEPGAVEIAECRKKPGRWKKCKRPGLGHGHGHGRPPHAGPPPCRPRGGR